MATNVYLKVEEPAIAGDSTDQNHQGQIEVLSWSHGFSQPTSATRSTAGSASVERANHSDMMISKYIDGSSVELEKCCWSGQHIGTMTIQQFRSAGPNEEAEFLTIKLEDVIISNYSVSSGGGDLPVESIGLNYGKVTYTYTPTDPATGKKGGAKSAFADLRSNQIG